VCYRAAVARLSLGSVTVDDLARLAALASPDTAGEPWNGAVEPLDEQTQVLLAYLTAKLAGAHPTTLNEATLWSRALYPLLELAEIGRVRAWAEVTLTAKDPTSDTELSGVVDGALAHEGVFAGTPGQPFLLVMEAKRVMGATDPRPALVAALIAVLWTKLGAAEAEQKAETFGCFTAGDIVVARVRGAHRSDGDPAGAALDRAASSGVTRCGRRWPHRAGAGKAR
jgi:hypothetical protein